jgi:broad specificity phosphatase PhoE
MRLLLVRHARAGARGLGMQDLARPLDPQGRAQATALATTLPALLGEHADIRSSPALRCIETITPLATAMGVTATVDAALLEGADTDELIVRIESGFTVPTVWASHGDVIPELLGRLERRGLDLGPAPRCAKGSVWVLEVEDGTVRAANYLPAPSL